MVAVSLFLEDREDVVLAQNDAHDLPPAVMALAVLRGAGRGSAIEVIRSPADLASSSR
jgi:hypothetical protein